MVKLIFEIDNKKIEISEKLIKLSDVLLNIVDNVDNDEKDDTEHIVKFTNFSYETYKEAITLCEEYKDSDVDVNVIKCINYLGFSEILDNISKYLAKQYYDIGFMDFYNKHSDKINIDKFANNKIISVNDIEKFPPPVGKKKEISPEIHTYTLLSGNPNVTPDYIEKHIDKPWNWSILSSNRNITEEFVKKYLKKDWTIHTEQDNSLADNPNISLEFIENYLNKDIYKECITGEYGYVNSKITMDYIIDYIKKYGEEAEEEEAEEEEEEEEGRCPPFDYSMWECAVHNGLITLKEIEDNMHKYKSLTMDVICTSPNLNIAFIKKYIDRFDDNCWSEISQNPGITILDIENNSNYPWEWSNILLNPNINMEFVKKYKDEKWNNKSDLYLLSRNPGIYISDVENNMEYDWDYSELSGNPNLTLSFIENNIDKGWNWYFISINSFIYERKMVCKKKYEELGLSDDIINNILKYIE